MAQDVSLAALRAFVAVAEELHFGRAAAKLFVSVSALSQQIGHLERHLGRPLFTRSSRSVALTAAGAELLPMAINTVASLARIDRWQRDLPGTGRSLRMGFVNPPTHAIDSVVSEFNEVDPEWKLTARHFSRSTILDALSADEIDLVTLWGPAFSDAVDGVEIDRSPRAVVLHERHPLTGRQEITLAELANEKVTVPAGSSGREQAWWIVDPRPDGSHPHRGTPHADQDEAFAIVGLKMEIFFTAEWIAQWTRYPDSSFARVADAEPVPLMIGARRGNSNPVVRNFLAAARRHELASGPGGVPRR